MHAHFVTFAEDILNGKLPILCNDNKIELLTTSLNDAFKNLENRKCCIQANFLFIQKELFCKNEIMKSLAETQATVVYSDKKALTHSALPHHS